MVSKAFPADIQDNLTSGHCGELPGGMLCGALLLCPLGLGHSLMKLCRLLVLGLGGLSIAEWRYAIPHCIFYGTSPLLVSARLRVPVLCYWAHTHL